MHIYITHYKEYSVRDWDPRKKTSLGRVSPGVMHIIRSETLGETFGETVGEIFHAKKSCRESWIGSCAWLPARLSLRLVFFTRGDSLECFFFTENKNPSTKFHIVYLKTGLRALLSIHSLFFFIFRIRYSSRLISKVLNIIECEAWSVIICRCIQSV